MATGSGNRSRPDVTHSSTKQCPFTAERHHKRWRQSRVTRFGSGSAGQILRNKSVKSSVKRLNVWPRISAVRMIILGGNQSISDVLLDILRLDSFVRANTMEFRLKKSLHECYSYTDIQNAEVRFGRVWVSVTGQLGEFSRYEQERPYENASRICTTSIFTHNSGIRTPAMFTQNLNKIRWKRSMPIANRRVTSVRLHNITFYTTWLQHVWLKS